MRRILTRLISVNLLGEEKKCAEISKVLHNYSQCKPNPVTIRAMEKKKKILIIALEFQQGSLDCAYARDLKIKC